MMHPVVDDASHQKALRRIEQLWSAKTGSPEGRELDALATLVDAYERRAFPILPPHPVEAIEARCEQLGWSRKQLEPLIGSRARVSEVLTGRRGLTLPMIRRLSASMGIPADVLIAGPRERSAKPGVRAATPRKKSTAPRSSDAQGAVAPGRRERSPSARSSPRS